MKRLSVMELDHIVLNVSQIDRALAFYTDILGLKPERLKEFKAGEVGFPSVRINQNTIIDLFPAPAGEPARAQGGKQNGNLNHFCMVIGRDDFSEIVDYLKDRNVVVREGPVSRWGARGRATSVYFLDPDGNEIELRCY
jgi:catechol 2,3-dioxygenase-like lactoylglutathione lyase family enzyme